MIVEITQAHITNGKWYLQHQPNHPRADALLAAIKDSQHINPTIKSTIRMDNEDIIIGSYRYQIGESLRYWRRIYHHRQGEVYGCTIKLCPPRERGGKGKAEKLYRKSRRRRR